MKKTIMLPWTLVLLTSFAGQAAPVANWTMDDSAGLLTFQDSSGNSNVGTLKNAAGFTAGDSGNALFLRSSYVTVPYSSSLNPTQNQICIDVWFNLSGANSGHNTIISKWASYYLRTFGTTQIKFGLFSNDNGTVAEIETTVTGTLYTNTWYHLVAIYDGSTVYMYLNDDLIASDTLGITLNAAATTNLMLGIPQWLDYSECFAGLLDQVRIYNSSSPDESSLVADWEMDETSGTTITDSSANQNDGTLTINGTRFTAGLDGNALLLGNSGYAIVPHSRSLVPTQNKISIDLWFNMTGSGRVNTLISKWGSYYLRVDGTTLLKLGLFSDSGAEWGFDASCSLTLGAWYHLVGTYDGTTASIYLNNELKLSKVVGITLNTTATNDLMVGIPQWLDTSEIFNGLIDEVRIYNGGVIAAPTFSQMSPYITGSTSVTISSNETGATIYYTTDGATPTTSSSIYNGTPVTVGNGTTLKAIAVVDDCSDSLVTSVTYVVPSSYNLPEAIPSGTATVDGNLSDWSDASWAPMNTTYDGTPSDITSAAYAVKWQAGKIYVAVKVCDTAHYFTDTYTSADGRDAVEIYLHTNNNGDAYSPNCRYAQQYIFGFMNSDTTKLWAEMGNASMYPSNMFAVPSDGTFDAVCKWAGKIEGNWLYYEVEITPYDYFDRLVTGNLDTCVASTLKDNDVMGLDVCVVGNNSGTYTGMKSENSMTGKSASWKQFGLHKLATDASFLKLQWGPVTPNGTSGSAYYLNDNVVDSYALGGTISGGPWELDTTGNVICSLSNTNTAKSAVKVGDYIYYTYSSGSSYVYRSSASTWDTGTAVTISDSMPLSSLATDGTYIYASTAKAGGQVMKYSVDAATGALTRVWATTDIDATGVRGLSYYNGSIDYIYAVSGGRNTAAAIGNTAHIYAIRTDTGAVTDMGAITDNGETYQIARNYNQLWVADAYNAADGQIYIYDLTNSTTLASTTPTTVCNPEGIGPIYGMTINDGFVWLATASGKVYGYTFEESFIPGDANGDGSVDVGDLGILAANYGTTSGATWAMGDFTGDGAVDVGDLGVLAANYGTGSSSACDFDADCAKVFGAATETSTSEDTTDEDSNSLCSSLGLSLIAGLAMLGLMLIKLDE